MLHRVQLNQCQMNLTKQSQPCPITRLSFDQIECGLKELVDRERKYLSMRNNEQLIKFKDGIYEKNLFKTMSTCSLINHQQVINLSSLSNFSTRKIILFLYRRKNLSID